MESFNPSLDVGSLCKALDVWKYEEHLLLGGPRASNIGSFML